MEPHQPPKTKPQADSYSKSGIQAEGKKSNPWDELGKINFLEDWLAAHKIEVGASYERLLAEVQDQRMHLYESADLKEYYKVNMRSPVLW